MHPAQAIDTAAPGSEPAQADWQGDAPRWTLTLRGDWRAAPWPAVTPPAALAADATVAFDGHALAGWNAALAARLWTLAAELRQRGAAVDLDALPAGLREVMTMAAVAHPDAVTAGNSKPAPAPAAERDTSRPSYRAEALVTVEFLGEVLVALVRWLGRRNQLRPVDLLQQIDLAGPRSLPIVLLTCGMIGLILAYMGGAQLGRFGAQHYLADVVTVGMVRELGGLMTGIILAGRVCSAYAAQLATMEAGEEVDALRVLGVDPIIHLVLPRLLALLLVSPGLVSLGALAGVLAAWPAAVLGYEVTNAEYLHQCLRAVNGTHVGIGLFKGVLYAALAALAGCREGLHAGRSAQAVGLATTTAVVKALVWIVAAACATTVLFTNLGY